jgi:hypothetical protein
MAWVTLASALLVLALMGRQGLPPVLAAGSQILPTGITLVAALRTPLFLTLACMLAFTAIGVSGIIVHIVPLLSDAGLTARRAGAIAGLLGVGIIIARSTTRELSRRSDHPRDSRAGNKYEWVSSIGPS